MTTTVVKTIGNGTRDYTSIQAWNDACPANLVTADQIWEGHLYPEGPGTNGEWVSGNDLNVSGSTTDATRYKILRAAPGYSFMEHANKLTNKLTYNTANGVAICRINNYSSGALTMGSPYSQLTGIQLAYNDNRYALLKLGNNCVARNCLLMGGSAAGAVENGEIYNSVIFSSAAGMYSIFGVSKATGCTFISLSGTSQHAYGQYGGSVLFKDCALFNYTAAGSVNAASSYNATNLASLPGSNNQLSLATASQFENTSWAWGSTTMDARVKAGHGLQFGVTDAVLGGFDILGQTRAATPTIGAFESIAGGGAQSLTSTLYSNNQVFYVPTVSSLVNISPNTFINTQSFYIATLSATKQLVADIYTQSSEFYAAAITTTNPINASVTITEANDGISATTSIRISPNATIAENSDTSNISVVLPIASQLTRTEASDSLTNTTIIRVSSTLVVTEGTDTSNISVVLPIVSSLTRTEASDSLTNTTVLGISASGNISEAQDTISSTGTLPIAIVSTNTEANDSLISNIGSVTNASSSITEANDVVSSSGVVRVTPSATITESNDTSNISVGIRNTATSTITENSDSVVSASGIRITPSVNSTETSDSVISNAFLVITTSVNQSEGNDTLNALAGYLGCIVDATINENSDVLVNDTDVRVSGLSNIAENSDSIFSVGTFLISSNTNRTEGNDSLVSDTDILVSGTTNRTEANDSLISTIGQTVGSVLVANEGNDSSLSSVSILVVGSVSLSDYNDQLTGYTINQVSITTNKTEGNDSLVSLGELGDIGPVANLIAFEGPDGIVSVALVLPILTPESSMDVLKLTSHITLNHKLNSNITREFRLLSKMRTETV